MRLDRPVTTKNNAILQSHSRKLCKLKDDRFYIPDQLPRLCRFTTTAEKKHKRFRAELI